MANEPRVVFDANVLVSSLLMPRSVPRQSLDYAIDHGVVLISIATLEELNGILARPKFQRYVTIEERSLFLTELIDDAQLIEPIVDVDDCRDPKDNKYLALALSGKATHLVSGDNDLLVLHPYHSIPILKPQAFLLAIAQS